MAREIPVQVVINGRDNSGPAFNSLGGSMMRVGEIAAGFITAQVFTRVADGILSMGTAAIDTTKQLEQNRIGLKGILGSFEEADATIARVKEGAKKTPFELPGLLEMTQLLATATKDGDRAVNLIMSLGDAVSFVGKGQPELDRIISNMQQIQAVGKASLMDLRQFGFAGIPIFEMLADKTGLAGEALQDFISEGGVTFEMLEGMFNQAGAAGGRFFGAMEAQSTTMAGIQSNISDTIGIIGTEIVQQSGLFDLLKAGSQGFLDFLSSNKENIINFFKGIVEGVIQVKNFMSEVFSSDSPVVQGIVAFISPLSFLMTHLQDLQKIVQSVTQFFEKQFSVAMESIQGSMDTIQPVLEFIIGQFNELAVVVGDVLTFAFNMLGEVVTFFWEEALKPLIEWLATNAGPILEVFMTVIGAIWSVIVQGIELVWGVARPVLEALWEVFKVVFTSIRDIVGAVFGFIGEVIRIAVDFWNNFLVPVVTLLGKIFEITFNAIKQVVSDVFNFFRPVIDPILSFFNNNVIPVIQKVGEIMSSVFNGVRDTVSNVWSGLGNIVKGAINGVIDILNGFIRSINDTINMIDQAGATIGVRINFRIGEIPRLFRGGTIRTDGPTLFMAGDNPGGVEEVSVKPIQGNNDSAGGSGGAMNVTVNVEGSVVSENELVEAIMRTLRSMSAMEAKSPSEFLDFNGRP